jgi:mannitol 2-dehydrogenase
VATDPLFAGFLLDYMTREAIPTLRPVPGVDLGQYAHQLIERFSNPEVGDTLARLAIDGSDRIPKFLLPVIRQQLAAGRPFTRSAAVIASWARYAEGTDENGAPHEVDDVLGPQLQAAARRQRSHRTAFLDGNRAVFGDLADDPRFTAVYSPILTALLDRGVRETFTHLDHYAPPSMAGRKPAHLERKSP